jgi:PleD family two-component response regulator
MTKPNIQQEQSTTSQVSSSRSDSIKLVSEILKRTNQLIQIGDFDRAQGELLLANRTAKEQYRTPPFSSPINDKFVAPQTLHAPLPLAPMEAMMAVISSSKQTPEALTEKPQVLLPEQTNDRSVEFKCYREALAKAWCDGALTDDEERHLQELRTVLEILDVEHEMFEKEIKYSSYKEALTKHISTGSVALEGVKSLSDLQKAFHISQEEHLQILGPSIQIKQHKQRDKILVIDDDDEFLNVLASSMTEDGFDVIAVATSDEAYMLLHKYIPDLILCDINLKTSTMNGFVLYEKIQTNKNLQNIPFVFLTGLTDEKLAWTGKELGADDYLLKPISRHTLLSTLHGRLKRFRQLKGFSSTPTPAFC